MSEVGFEIIAAVECKNAACTTDGDIATSKDIADKITQRINAAIQSGVVAGVIANALSLDCLVAWGGITSPSVSSKFVSEGSLSKVGVAIPTSGTFYPVSLSVSRIERLCVISCHQYILTLENYTCCIVGLVW